MCAWVLGWFAKSVMDDDVNTGIAIMIIAVCLYIYSIYGFIKSEVFSEQPAQKTESQETQKDDLKEEKSYKRILRKPKRNPQNSRKETTQASGFRENRHFH